MKPHSSLEDFAKAALQEYTAEDYEEAQRVVRLHLIRYRLRQLEHELNSACDCDTCAEFAAVRGKYTWEEATSVDPSA